MAKRIDPNTLSFQIGTFYPTPYDKPCRARARKRLGDAASLTQFGVNLTRLSPGAWSSQRHWHTEQDEFIYLLEGEAILVSEAGEEILKPGDCAGFKAGEPDGHHLQNRSERDVVYLEIGTRNAGDGVQYSDIDMVCPPNAMPAMYTRRDGTPYQNLRRRGPDEID
jgi:uncharacterized cupin superfamily protein